MAYLRTIFPKPGDICRSGGSWTFGGNLTQHWRHGLTLKWPLGWRVWSRPWSTKISPCLVGLNTIPAIRLRHRRIKCLTTENPTLVAWADRDTDKSYQVKSCIGQSLPDLCESHEVNEISPSVCYHTCSGSRFCTFDAKTKWALWPHTHSFAIAR